MIRLAILLTLAAFLVLAGVVLANGASDIDWWVLGGGGGYTAAGNYTLNVTIGQPVAGVTTTGGSELCAGFWCVAAAEYTVYLPAITKNYAQ